MVSPMDAYTPREVSHTRIETLGVTKARNDS